MVYTRGAAHMCSCYVIHNHWPIEDGADPQLLYVSNKKQLHVGGVQWILYCPHPTMFIQEFHCISRETSKDTHYCRTSVFIQPGSNVTACTSNLCST